MLIFDEATSALYQETAEGFAKTINALRGKVTMLLITHAMPRALKIDEVWQLGKDGVQLLKAVKGAAQSSPLHAEPAESTPD